jgi:hypothetical protein
LGGSTSGGPIQSTRNELPPDRLARLGVPIKQVEVGVWFNAFVKGDYQITSAERGPHRVKLSLRQGDTC